MEMGPEVFLGFVMIVVGLQTFWISRSIDRISALIDQGTREHEEFRKQILELHEIKADKQEAR